MSNLNKTPLEEAKNNFEEIKKFAFNEAKKELQKEMNEKLDKVLSESLQNISLNYDEEGAVANITINKDDGQETNVTVDLNTGEATTDNSNENVEDLSPEEEIPNEEDNEPIEIEENMGNFNEQDEQGQPAETQPAEAQTPNQEELIQNLARALSGIINPEQFGQAALQNSGEGTSEQGVEFIDDEQDVPAEIPAETPAPEGQEMPPAEPAQPAAPEAQIPPQEEQPISEEDSILEFDLDTLGMEKENSDDIVYEIETGEDEFPKEKMFEINVEEDKKEKMYTFEVDDENENVEEMKGISKLLRNTSNRLGLEPRTGTPNINESVIKAQYESKLDGLQQENRRLNESVREFQETFTDLRKQFDEMQTFNAKLAYANKIFASGGFSTETKTKIAEEFDSAKTVDDAKRIYQRIIKENDLKSVKSDPATKLKANREHTTQSKNTLYESDEMRRMKKLAGMEKNEEN